mmetsp:Transcript_1198/g.2120  ORF Transcript_1198/g.2120 Transcript_1198/m.2120 type:complete len:214 (+) Transcript_1198:2815-3456(+)
MPGHVCWGHPNAEGLAPFWFQSVFLDLRLGSDACLAFKLHRHVWVCTLAEVHLAQAQAPDDREIHDPHRHFPSFGGRLRGERLLALRGHCRRMRMHRCRACGIGLGIADCLAGQMRPMDRNHQLAKAPMLVHQLGILVVPWAGLQIQRVFSCFSNGHHGLSHEVILPQLVIIPHLQDHRLVASRGSQLHGLVPRHVAALLASRFVDFVALVTG